MALRISSFVPKYSNVSSGPYTASSGERILANTSSVAITINLPASPLVGDVVIIYDADNTFDLRNVTVGRNGSNINGAASNLVLADRGLTVEFVYFSASKGWRVFYEGTGEIAVPAGVMMDFGGPTAPSGWFMCDGRSLTTAAYPNLFAALQYTYGGSGANFNLPDFRGRFARYNDNMGTGAAGRDTGSRPADKSQGYSTARPTTVFTAGSSSVSGFIDGGSHQHSLTLGNNWGNGGAAWVVAGWCVDNGEPQGNSTKNTTYTSHGHTHSLTAAGQTITGGGDSETRPINVSCNRIIKY
jgi:microcystin-dependent protein